MMMNLLKRLARHAESAGSHLAYREAGAGGRELSYETLHDRAHALAARLRAKLGAGDVVMLCLPNLIEFPVAFLGILASACNVFPVSADTAEVELLALARQANVKGIIGTDRVCAVLRDVAPLVLNAAECLRSESTSMASNQSGDLLLCSSGTTDRPKIVVRDSASIDAVSANMCKAIGFTPQDRVLAIVPLSHSYGLEHGLLAPIWAGACVSLCNGFDLDVVTNELARGGISLFPSTPSVYDMLCKLGPRQKLVTVRKAYAAGAPLPASVADAFADQSGPRIGQLYGLTEVGSVTFADPADEHFDPRSVGQAFQGVRIKIVDSSTRADLGTGQEGEVHISAPSMFRGYLGEAATSTVDGYFPTGDVGRLDAFGNLTITGRIKLLIEVGGRKVNVMEVEGVIAQYPSVGEAVVVGMRVSETVSRLKAYVTPRTPGEAIDADALRRFLRERLTAYKVPREIEVRQALPKSPAGKVLRRLLENS